VKDIIIRGGENIVSSLASLTLLFFPSLKFYFRLLTFSDRSIVKCEQDSVTVENALYADPRVLEAAAVGVPDERLGELVAAIVSVRPGQDGEVTEASLIAQAKSRCVFLFFFLGPEWGKLGNVSGLTIER